MIMKILMMSKMTLSLKTVEISNKKTVRAKIMKTPKTILELRTKMLQIMEISTVRQVMETRFFQMMIVIKPMKRINKTIQMRRISILKKTTMKLKKRLTSKTMGIRHKKQRATVKILKRLTGFGQVQLFILQTTEANADQISHLQCQQPLKVCIKFKQVFFMTFLNKVSLTVNKKNKMYAQMEEPWSLS